MSQKTHLIFIEHSKAKLDCVWIIKLFAWAFVINIIILAVICLYDLFTDNTDDSVNTDIFIMLSVVLKIAEINGSAQPLRAH